MDYFSNPNIKEDDKKMKTNQDQKDILNEIQITLQSILVDYLSNEKISDDVLLLKTTIQKVDENESLLACIMHLFEKPCVRHCVQLKHQLHQTLFYILINLTSINSFLQDGI